MVKAKTKTKQNRARKPVKQTESDSAYLLKLVLYMFIGSLWIKISTDDAQYPIPVGFIIGIFFAFHEHFQIDKKIEFALLLVAMLVGFWLPIGIFIAL